MEWLEGEDGKGCRVFLKACKVSAVREQGETCWVCVDGQWVMVRVVYDQLCGMLRGEPVEAKAAGA